MTRDSSQKMDPANSPMELWSTARLLACCLGGTAVPPQDVATLRRLLWTLGGYEQTLAATPARLETVATLSADWHVKLRALAVLSRREAAARLSWPRSYTDSRSVAEDVRRHIGGLQREVFGVLFLDTRHRFIVWELLFQGTLGRAHVYAREVLRRALELNAAAVVLAHNHPSGSAEPSDTDVRLTLELRDLLARLEVAVLDHIVVTPQATTSLAELGWLEPLR